VIECTTYDDYKGGQQSADKLFPVFGVKTSTYTAHQDYKFDYRPQGFR
jgi:hypothetical protein